VVRQRGLSLIESAAVLGVASIAMGMLANQMADNSEVLKAKAAAEKMVTVHAAAQDYIKARGQELLAATTAGGSPLVVPVGRPDVGAAIPGGPAGHSTLPSVQGGGFLPPNFVDRNGYNQRHALLVRKVSDGGVDRLESVVTTYGGIRIPDRQLPRIAGFVGATGGYVPAASGNTEIIGVQGGWRSPLAEWSGISEGPAPGAVVATMAYESGAVLSDYLYRNNVGIPEANRMNTALDMGANDVSNARNVTASGRVTGGAVVAGAAPASLPAGTKVYTDGDMLGINVWASQDVGAGGNVTAGGNVAAGGNVSAGGYVEGTRFQDRTNANYYLQPAGASRLGDLDADAINLNALVYDTTRGIAKGDAIRLRDLLPRFVPNNFHLVTAASPYVPIPSCPNGTPNVVLSPKEDSQQFDVVVDTTTAPAVSGVSGSTTSGMTFSTGTYVTSVTSSGRKTKISRQFAVSTVGAPAGHWRIAVTGTPNSVDNPATPVDENLPWVMQATTYCRYK